MKRIIPFLFSLPFIIHCCSAAATNMEPYSSLYISKYDAISAQGVSSGAISIAFDVRASKSVTSIGVKEIAVYRAGGSKVATITGTVDNGLLKSKSARHSGAYTYTGTSGAKYYAKVTLFAKDSSGSSSKTVTTATVTAR